jgi:DNA-binding beta-propeller fold protein YncE
MSQINVNTITDEAGTGPVNFPYDFTIAGSALVIPPAHDPVSVSGATQALNVGSYNFFNAGDLTVDTTLTFTSVPTDALWTYTAKAGYTEAYTVEDAAYSGLSLYVANQENYPQGVAFSTDGTKMYVVGAQTDSVHQYTLATAWNVSTATYASLSVSVAAQEDQPFGLAFSSDGTKMYIVGATNDTVYQYTLATAWAINTATYASLSKSVAAQDTIPSDLAFSSDGTKMYVVGLTTDTVYQYNLGTAWNVSTATYPSIAKTVSPEDDYPQGLAFSSDGTKMFVLGSTNDRVYQYTLSTPWHVGTATYASLSFNVITQETFPCGLAFSSDGTKMYVVGPTNDTVYQYNSAITTTLTVPAAVENTPATTFYPYNQVTYTFVTNDGGTTVKLIGEEIT